MTANKSMTGEQLDELMTDAVNMQRDSEKANDRPAAMFAYAVQVAVLELRKVHNDVAGLAGEIDRLRALVIRVPMPVLMPKEMVHQLYFTETKRCRTCNDGLRGGCSSCIFYKR